MYVKCSTCSKSVPSRQIKNHLKYVHHATASKYRCSVESCGRFYSNNNSLLKHLQTHDLSMGTLEASKQNNGLFLINELPEQIGTFPHIETTDSTSHQKEFLDESLLLTKALEMISTSYADPSVARKQVQILVSAIDEFFKCSYFEDLKKAIIKCETEDDREMLITKITKFQTIMNSVDTEYKRFKVLEEMGYFIKPEKLFFDIIDDKDKFGNLVSKELNGQIIPLGKVLKVFFELPNVFNTIRDYYLHLQSNCNEIQNIVQTNFWKSKVLYPSQVVEFPIFAYEDGFETGNPLGSHAGIYNLNVIHIVLACIPPEFKSRLENIFLAQLYHADDAKNLEKEIIYRRLILELQDLDSVGIEIDVEDKKIRIYFRLIIITGDNLGLNHILGFTKGFAAKFFCRFCKAPSSLTSRMCLEDRSFLRTLKNYEADVKLNDLKKTGIQEQCSFNSLPSFHVIDNYSVDILHDLLEGVCRYEVSYVFYEFIFQKHYFSLNVLNWRMKWFRYEGNEPPSITLTQLQSKDIKMSGSEMLSFMFNSPLIFGDLVTDKNDMHWKLFKLLRKILIWSLKISITTVDIEFMRKLVFEHHSLYIQLYGYTLKPKHHFLVHYPMIMESVGPLRQLWTMRSEAKHRPSKIYAKVTFNHKNICYSLALKNQLNLSDVFLKNRSLISKEILYKMSMKPLAFSEKLCLPDKGKNYVNLDSLIVNNIKYIAETVVLVGIKTSRAIFGTIEKLYCKEENKDNLTKKDCVIIVSVLDTSKYDDHLQAYIVGEPISMKVLNLDELCDYKIRRTVLMPNGVSYLLYD